MAAAVTALIVAFAAYALYTAAKFEIMGVEVKAQIVATDRHLQNNRVNDTSRSLLGYPIRLQYVAADGAQEGRVRVGPRLLRQISVGDTVAARYILTKPDQAEYPIGSARTFVTFAFIAALGAVGITFGIFAWASQVANAATRAR